MQTNNNTEKTREIMGQLQQCALQLAIGFEGAAKRLPADPTERGAVLLEAHQALREMQLSLVNAGSLAGVKFTFHPNDHAFRMCVYCSKPLSAHIGRDCNCPTE